MRNISQQLKDHLASGTTTIATCWKITRRDGVILGFGDFDDDVEFESVTYKAASGFISGDQNAASDIRIDNSEVSGFLDSVVISKDDLLLGKYDYAQIEIFIINHQDVSMGKMILFTGFFSKVQFAENSFSVELNSLAGKLSNTVGELYSPTCRARLGDSKCQVNMASFTKTGSITSLISNGFFSSDLQQDADGFYEAGLITFTSGANNGLITQIKHSFNGNIILAIPTLNPLAVSDTFSIEAGCNKTVSVCKSKFNNVINFRGEPDVPGSEFMFQSK